MIDSKNDKVDPDDNSTLIYTHLYPFLRIPPTLTDVETYILLAVDTTNVSRTNKSFCQMRLCVWVMSHQDHMKMKGKNGTRIDYISDLIEEMLVGQIKYGFNKLELISNVEKVFNSNYQYRELIFHTNDLREAVC